MDLVIPGLRLLQKIDRTPGKLSFLVKKRDQRSTQVYLKRKAQIPAVRAKIILGGLL
jgi:hypothetical protein